MKLSVENVSISTVVASISAGVSNERMPCISAEYMMVLKGEFRHFLYLI